MCDPTFLETMIEGILIISGTVLIVAGTAFACYAMWRIIHS